MKQGDFKGGYEAGVYVKREFQMGVQSWRFVKRGDFKWGYVAGGHVKRKVVKEKISIRGVCKSRGFHMKGYQTGL